MENASKALLMAGGLLIGLLVISILILTFSKIGDYSNSIDEQKAQSEVAAYNKQFEPYNRDDVTLTELKSLWNKIQSINKKYPEYNINTNIEEVYPNIDKDFKERDNKGNLVISERARNIMRFKCIIIEYGGADGRISQMNFIKVVDYEETEE